MKLLSPGCRAWEESTTSRLADRRPAWNGLRTTSRCLSRHRGACDLFSDEHGFTTTSMVLSLLITLALVFTAAQVYRVNSSAAEVQDVADAAALAAENQIAEFMIVARFCDAVVLSLSLAGITTLGLGIAALCTPATAELSGVLIEAGKKLLETRNDFSDRAVAVLDKLQEALPYFAAACAASVASANDGDSEGASYLGAALLVPNKGDVIGRGTSGAGEELVGELDEKSDDIRKKAQEAEDAAREANEAKQRAFMRDCGDNPNYCMYERAAHLAGLSGTRNPLYASVDTWSFSVALERARQYYMDRYSNEKPGDDSVEEQSRFFLRVAFYGYADRVLWDEAYVHESADGFEAYFPHLPKNTSEMRASGLYTSERFSISDESGKEVMHAYGDCPGITGKITKVGSIAYMESAGLETCPVCNFTAASMGKVAAASTSINNGFEYHYEAVAREAELYEQETRKANGPRAEVQEEVGGLLDQLAKAFEEAKGKRIDVSPPGAYGALAFVVNTGTTSAVGGFANRFVSASGSLGTRAAISAATLIDEGSDEGRTVLNSMLDGLREGGGAMVGAFGVVLDAWSAALSAYADGYEAVSGGIESGLNALPLVGASGLGTWVAGRLRLAFDGVGLQPAELQALKPVLVNSVHVAAKDDGSVGASLIAVKQKVVAYPMGSTDLFSGMITEAEKRALDKVDGLGDVVEIASIELLGEGGSSIPITIPLPSEVKRFGVGVLQDLFDRLRAYRAEVAEVRAWE